jgi:hypothetical protein
MVADHTPDDPLRELRTRARALARVLDEDGRVVRWPKRNRDREIILEHLVAHFESGRVFTEHELGMRLDELHTFHDAAMLRRAMIDRGMLQRRRDGSAYWKPAG